MILLINNLGHFVLGSRLVIGFETNLKVQRLAPSKRCGTVFNISVRLPHGSKKCPRFVLLQVYNKVYTLLYMEFILVNKLLC